MIRWWQSLVACTSRTEPGTPLALFRIGAGLGVLLTFAPTLLDGLGPMMMFDAAHGGYRPLAGNFWLIKALGGATAEVMTGLLATSMLGGFLMMLGLGGRVTALVTLQTTLACVHVNSHAGGSHDDLLTNALFLVLLAPSTATLSLDCRIRTGRWTSDVPVAAWVRPLVMFQIVLCYWSTGVQKVSAHWTPGGDFSALYYILQQPGWHRIDMTWLGGIFPLTQLATATTWLWEVSNPLWLVAVWFAMTPDRPGRLRRWSNRLRVREGYAFVGVMMHLLILAFMNVGPFTAISLAFYPCFWHHRELAAAWGRLRVLVTGGAGPTDGKLVHRRG